ncbi:MAG: carboxypeptidase-like regulatory domain-containing protein [Bacteroidales bacterium]|nr:carboxypeptidase-like regulatory domain-containing protein [Bacteroidales bacterium]
MKNIFVFIVLLFCGINVLFSQIKGNVKCADGTPASFATVVLYPDSKTNSSPLKYTITNKEGNFTLDINNKTGYWITVKYVGYNEYRYEMQGNETFLNIQLELNENSNLNEVVVKSSYSGITVKGDTIAFDTEHFKTGEEETVGDVLKKLPGMEVSDNGDVSFGGKQVDKILVDGKDMFSSGSDGVINNLSADALQSAEILKNYKTGSIVDDFRNTDLTALNLKTDGKHRISGKVNLNAGFKEKVKGNADVLYMGEKLYLTSALAANNTGESVFSFRDYIKNVVGLDNLLSHNRKALNFSSDEVALIFPPQNVYKNINSIATLSGTYKPNDRFKINSSLILNGSNVDAKSLSEQLYYAFDVTNVHRLKNDNRNRFISFNLTETYKISEKSEISNRTHLQTSSLKNDDSLSESGLTNMFANQNNDLRKTNIQDEVAFNVKMGKGLLSAHLIFDYVKRNYTYNLLTDQNILPTLYNEITPNSFELPIKKKINNTTISPDITYSYPIFENIKFQSTFTFNYNENKFSYEDLNSPVEESLTWNDYALDLSFNKMEGFFQFNIGTSLKETKWKTTFEDMKTGSSFFVLPQATLRLHFSTSNDLSLSASIDNKPIEMEYLLRDTIVNDYSSIYKGSLITDPFCKSKSLSLNYNFFDMFYNIMFFINATLNETDVTKAHTIQNNSIVHISEYDNDGTMSSKSVMAHLNKGFSFLPIDVKLSGGVNTSKSETFLNNVKDEINSLNYNMNLGISSRMKTIFNFTLGAGFVKSNYDYKVSDITNDMLEKNLNGSIIFVYKKLRGNIHMSYAYADNSMLDKNYYNLGFRVEYQIKKWCLHINGDNILNLNNTEWVSISATPLYTSTTVFRRMPGYILMGVGYKF